MSFAFVQTSRYLDEFLGWSTVPFFKNFFLYTHITMAYNVLSVYHVLVYMYEPTTMNNEQPQRIILVYTLHTYTHTVSHSSRLSVRHMFIFLLFQFFFCNIKTNRNKIPFHMIRSSCARSIRFIRMCSVSSFEMYHYLYSSQLTYISFFVFHHRWFISLRDLWKHFELQMICLFRFFADKIFFLFCFTCAILSQKLSINSRHAFNSI